MNHKGFANIILVAIMVLLAGGAVTYFIITQRPELSPLPMPTPTSVGFPDLVLYNQDGLGGLGRLSYNDSGKDYSLVDFKFTPYVVEGTAIRPMKPKEGGGTMAVPTAVKSIQGTVLAMVSSYNTLLKLDSDFSILRQKGFDVFTYAGSPTRHMEANNGALFFFKNGDTLVSYDENLEKLGELKMISSQNLWPNFNQFIIAQNKVYIFEGVDAGPASDCALSPEPDPLWPNRTVVRCGERYNIVAIVNVSDPRNMQIEKFEKVEDNSPPVYARLKAVDPEKQQWLVVKGYGESQDLQLRPIENIARIISEKKVSGEVATLTNTAPFYAVVKKNDALFLVPINTNSNSITIGKEFDIKMSYTISSGEEPVLKQYGDRIFIASGHRLRVINVKNAPRLELSQDFRDSYGKQFSIAYFDFGDRLAPAKTGVDKELLRELLQADYYGNNELHQIQNQIAKLTPADTWAIPILTAALRKAGSASAIRSLSVEGFGNIGTATHTAIPAILDASMCGAAICGDIELMIQALQKIDLEGKYILPELPLFEKRHYTAGARHISKEILLKLKDPASQEALKNYK